MMIIKFIYKLIYGFNANILAIFLPNVVIANSKLYEDGDEYVLLRGTLWVEVKSKTTKFVDMIPITMVSERCIDRLLQSRFKRKG